MTAIDTAPELQEPEFLGKYQPVPDDDRQQGTAFVRQKEAEGYGFFARAFPRSGIMVGDINGEWRIFDSFVLLKRPVPFAELQAHQFPDDAVVLETHKHYANMSSIGRTFEYAEFSRADLESWAAFFGIGFTSESASRPISEMFI